MSGSPWLKFYPTDWRSDPRLRMCSLAARGLWMEMIALMHEATPYGHLLVSGLCPTDAQLAVLAGAPSDQIPDLVGELEAAGVFSRTKDGVIYSRKMTRMAKKAAVARKNGQRGGNPTLGKHEGFSASDNPPDKGRDKPQKPDNPETRIQKGKNEGADAPSFDEFWPKAYAVWKALASPAGSKQEAFTAWAKLSGRQRWIAFLVLPHYAGFIREERRTFPKRNAKHVCRYLSGRLFMDWEDQVDFEEDDDAEVANSGRAARSAGPDLFAGQRGADPHAAAGGSGDVGGVSRGGDPVRPGGGAGADAGRKAVGGRGEDPDVGGVRGGDRGPGKLASRATDGRADAAGREPVAGHGAHADAVGVHGRSEGRRALTGAPPYTRTDVSTSFRADADAGRVHRVVH